jgi:adenosylmethionine-8-amino-7-oxononanoate aminotransferase
MPDTETLIAWDKAHSWHPFTPMADWCAPGHEPLVLVRGEGAWLEDSRGRRYLDGNSSIWTNIHGHAHPRITAAIREQAGRLDHASFLGFTNDVATRLARELAELAGLPRVFFSDDGATAVEVALRLSVQYWHQNGRPERKTFVAFDHAYHGDTLGSASLGGISTFIGGVERLGYPVRHAADLAAFRALLESGGEDIAGVIIEPLIQGAAGMRTWPAGMLRELRELCDRRDLFLILDEVMTAFGRTGTMFACQSEGVLPDFLCVAKGLTGGTVPLAATLTTQRVFEGFLGPVEALRTFYYGHSYTGNPIGAAAALASLAVFREEGVLEALQPKIAKMARLLEPLRAHPNVEDVRQCGFMAGIDLVRADGTPFPWTDLTGARVCQAARRHGLLTRPIRDTVTLIPPLCLSLEELARCVRAIELGIDEVCGPSE